MARNNLNLNASLRLKTGEFKKGVRDIQGSLKSLQRSFLGVAGALGAGLGLTQLLSNLKNTAVQLSVAQATLQNVSQVTKTFTDGTNKMDVAISNYGENLKYVQDLAKKYGQDQIALTQNFAQFTAACKGTNIALEEQRDIFDALTQAATYYHMSSSQVDDMQRAIVQMASKGKVASEELRRQLGNSLPGAFNLMAASLGVSNAELEKMMRNGEVLAEDALPKFAAMLKTVTSNYSLDSLQISLNQLKNSWTELVDNANFDRIYNNIVKGANSVLKFFGDSFWPKVLGIGTGIAGGLGFNSLRKGIIDTKSVMAEGRAEFDKYWASLEKVTEKLDKLDKKSNAVKSISHTFGTSVGGSAGTLKGFPARLDERNLQGLAEKDIKALREGVLEYNNTMLKLSEAQKKATGKPIFNKNQIRAIQQANTEIKNSIKGINAAGSAFDKFNSKATLAGTLFRKLGNAVRVFADMTKTALYSIGIGVLISLITTLIGKVVEYNQKLKEAKNIAKDYVSEMGQVNARSDENSAILQSQLRILQDTSRSEAARIGALKKINELTGEKYSTKLIKEKDAINEANKALGKTQDAYKDIVDKVGQWIEATKLQAKVQYQAQKQAEAEGAIAKIEADNEELKRKRQQLVKSPGLFPGIKLGNIERAEKINAEALKQWQIVLKGTKHALDELGVSLVEVQQEMNNTGGGSDKGKPKGIQKVFNDWKEEKEKLANQLKEAAITQKEYDEEFDKLVLKTWGEAAGTGKLSLKDILGKKGKLTEMEEWYKSLAEYAQTAREHILEKDIEDSFEKFLDALDKEIDNAIKEETDKYLDKTKRLGEIKVPNLKAPDTWDNYKQTDTEIWQENADSIQDYVDSLKEIRETLKELKLEYGNLGIEGEAALKGLNDAIDKLGGTATTLRNKARVEEWKEDIKELQEQFGTDFYNSIKNVAQGFERLYDTFKDLQDRFDDAEGIEQVILAFETVFEVLETGMAIYETFKKLTETTTALQKAQGDLQMQNMEKELAMKGAITAADVTGAATAAEAGAVKVATAHATANALKSVATAGAAANAMELPFPYNLAALATNMAALTAALSAGKALEAFADGGIVGGNSMSGDHNLIRANSGEMILNKTQQSQLWDFIKNGSQGFGGGKVEFEIRGDKLQGVLSNYERKRRG